MTLVPQLNFTKWRQIGKGRLASYSLWGAGQELEQVQVSLEACEERWEGGEQDRGSQAWRSLGVLGKLSAICRTAYFQSNCVIAI